MFTRAWLLVLLCLLADSACPKTRAEQAPNLEPRARVLRNRAAYIPPVCYTKLVDEPGGPAANPCYVCHADAQAPNHNSQPELQLAYDFPQLRAGHSVENPWTNLFVDRRAALAAIPDRELASYVAQSNYTQRGANLLAQRLSALPSGWDVNRNGRWDGYVPDAAYLFDEAGFDHAADGGATGWRAFAYYPLPGAFLPANGSFDDVLIRLPEVFRQDAQGRADLRVYALNLAIVEALIKRRDVAIEPSDEVQLGVDLDRDGELGLARTVAYAWRALQPGSMQYVGLAEHERVLGRVHLAPGLFPQGTEFLHSVRYLALAGRAGVVAAPRMKELRYARKHSWLSYADLAYHAQREAKEAAQNPDRPEQFLGDAERGVHNASGWTYQGFIEDAAGQLRPQSYEETVYCMGCHGGISATVDAAFAYPRKLETGPAHGFYHALSSELSALPDPHLRASEPRAGEYQSYLLRNPAGDGFRANAEVYTKFFDREGKPRAAVFERLARDIATLLLPSAQRALALNKAYLTIVREQSYVLGREALVEPARSLLREVGAGTPTGVRAALP